MQVRLVRSPKRDEHQQQSFYVTPFVQVWRDGFRYKQWSIIIGWLLWYVTFEFKVKDKP